ncbi:MAG: CBS domain-containing protein [Pseudomonadota bacterium]
MTLNQILDEKGRSVFTIETSVSLRSAAGLLHERRVGAMVALNAEGSVAGVLSERDIIRALAQDGQDALTKTVADFMTSDVVTASPEETVADAMAKMTRRRIRHLPIMRGDKLEGVVSIGDLVKWKIAEAEAEANALKSYIHA